MCVRQQGRLSLVGGGMVKRFGLPSLSYHQGCESQIKLSQSSFLSFSVHSFPPHPSLFHTLVSFPFLYLLGLTFISSAICLSLPPNFHLGRTFSVFIHILVQHTYTTAMEMIAFQNKKTKCNKADPIFHLVPITRLERRWPTLGGGSVIKIDEAI